jgi:hypothetical protein
MPKTRKLIKRIEGRTTVARLIALRGIYKTYSGDEGYADAALPRCGQIRPEDAEHSGFPEPLSTIGFTLEMVGKGRSAKKGYDESEFAR